MARPIILSICLYWWKRMDRQNKFVCVEKHTFVFSRIYVHVHMCVHSPVFVTWPQIVQCQVTSTVSTAWWYKARSLSWYSYCASFIYTINSTACVLVSYAKLCNILLSLLLCVFTIEGRPTSLHKDPWGVHYTLLKACGQVCVCVCVCVFLDEIQISHVGLHGGQWPKAMFQPSGGM